MNGEELKETWEFVAEGTSSEWFCIYKRGSILLNDTKGEQTRREQCVPAVVRAGQAGLLQKCFADSSSPGRTEKWQWMPLFNSAFCQDCFLKAIMGQSIWRLICIGIRRWKEKYFQLRPEPNLSPSATALKDSCQPEYQQVKYAPKARIAPCWSSEQQHNQEFVRWCMVLQNIHKEKNKSYLLNKLQLQNIFSALKFNLRQCLQTTNSVKQHKCAGHTMGLWNNFQCVCWFNTKVHSVYVGSIQKCIALEIVDWAALPLHFLETLFPILLQFFAHCYSVLVPVRILIILFHLAGEIGINLLWASLTFFLSQ